MRTPEFIGSFWREAVLSRFFEVLTVLVGPGGVTRGAGLKTVKTVPVAVGCAITPLKRGVNEISLLIYNAVF
jgi:hypothetical protein